MHHPLDERCANNVDSYIGFLTDPDETLIRHPLDDIVTTWKPLLRNDNQRQWLSDFEDRYLNLQLSDAAWDNR